MVTTLAMQWFNPQGNANRIRFRAMMESGELLDEVADVVQTQVIANKARASIRTRDAVPLYHHTEENQPGADTSEQVGAPCPPIYPRYECLDAIANRRPILGPEISHGSQSTDWIGLKPLSEYNRRAKVN